MSQKTAFKLDEEWENAIYGVWHLFISDTITLKKYQLFDLNVKGQRQMWSCWYMTHPLNRLMIVGMWLYNDERVSHVPSWSQFDLDLWPWGQIFYLRVLTTHCLMIIHGTPPYQISLIYRKNKKGYDSDTITLKKYQLFDLNVKGQRQNVVMLVHQTSKR
jgi:hypothetical protein